MRSAMSLSNVEYAFLKKKCGLHNWGFSSSKDRFDFDMDEADIFLDEVMSITEETTEP